MAQHQNDLAVNLMNLFDPNSYTEFGEGFFTNQPKMFGFYYIFKKLSKPKFCLIINASNVKYPTDMVKIGEFVYIVLNVSNPDSFIDDLSSEYLPSILQTINQHMQKENTRTLPYGYYFDENGELKVDLKKANEVRRIYNRYMETESVRQIASEMRTNFSHIRDILHDNEEYMQMQRKILPITILKKVNELLAANVKGTFKKKDMASDANAAKQRARRLQAEAKARTAQNEQPV